MRNQPINSIADKKNTPPELFQGLTEQEAIERLKQEGYNELAKSQSRSLLSIAWESIQDPIFLLLIGGSIIYWILGDLQEALILLGFVLSLMGIGLYQEGKTEHALEALRDISSPRALVVRDGKRKRIAGREVVRGDLLVLAEGDRVAADGIVKSCSNLSTDESLLTGESLTVRKVASTPLSNHPSTPLSNHVAEDKVEMARPGGDELTFVYAGTLVVQGQGIAEVQAIGSQTEMGKIGNALQKVKPEITPLQKEMNRLVSRLFGIALSLCVAIVIIYGLTTGDWLKGILAGITLAMAILPNEFPVVVTVFVALGAWRISRNHVLARRASAVETIGAATVLCVDKTGTLTLNQMAVQQLFPYQPENSQSYDLATHPQDQLPEAVHQLVEFCILASQRDPFDPMEKAFYQLGDRYLANTEHLHKDWKLLKEYPLSPHLLAMSHVWQSADLKQYEVAAKGAPEAIADLCHFTDQQKQNLAKQVSEMAEKGLRVLGVAKASLLDAPLKSLPPHPALSLDRLPDCLPECLPDKQHDFPFQFIGLVGLSDPVRPNVAAAVKECHTAGIRVVMITGDYPETAQAISRQIGLLQMGAIMTGAELEKMSDPELQQRIQSTNIFARTVPEQKLRVVNALKSKGEIVAMTGDGVNDAPALKAAQIGIAMGQRGTDVARESAALVLLDDDFSSIVQAVKLGRRIFDNLRKAMAYLVAVHIPIAGMSLIPVLFKLPLVLLPIHIAFLHLIIDPACSIVLEAEPAEPNAMKRSPRNPKEPLFGRKTGGLALLQGLGSLAIALVIFGIAVNRGLDESETRALSFTTLILANLGLILSERSTSRLSIKALLSPNPALWWVIGGGLTFLALILYVPFLRQLFSFSYLHPDDLAICLAGGVISLLWFESLKLMNKTVNQKRALVPYHGNNR